jgi:hypothetical protein
MSENAWLRQLSASKIGFRKRKAGWELWADGKDDALLETICPWEFTRESFLKFYARFVASP